MTCWRRCRSSGDWGRRICFWTSLLLTCSWTSLETGPALYPSPPGSPDSWEGPLPSGSPATWALSCRSPQSWTSSSGSLCFQCLAHQHAHSRLGSFQQWKGKMREGTSSSVPWMAASSAASLNLVSPTFLLMAVSLIGPLMVFSQVVPLRSFFLNCLWMAVSQDGLLMVFLRTDPLMVVFQAGL